MARIQSNALFGLVDMGSNGIRFSISDLSPPSARALPTLFQDRIGISLYDAQYCTGAKGPIPQGVIDDVVAALLRFKVVCSDFGVPATNIKVLATEATRTAANSVEYREQIKSATGWEVAMLSKEEEGRIGAMGVASSFAGVEGLLMDLGGGSTQITWMIAKDGNVEISPRGSVSFPYGAAAMTRRLAEVDAHAKAQLAEEMKANFIQAYHQLKIPEALHAKAAADGGFTLYLSGGGFRGWGYLLLSQQNINPYPIPIINGFQVSIQAFRNVAGIQAHAASQDTFRVSKRRAAQVPAVAFLVGILVDALPSIKEIRFCQGGVREGFLFDSLSKEIRALDPLSASSARYAPPSSPAFAEMLQSALPPNDHGGTVPSSLLAPSLLRAAADLLFVHSSLPKESTTLAALYAPITGILASAHGISHKDRALIALILRHRWDGKLPAPHDTLEQRLHALLTAPEVFWCRYLGKIGGLVGDAYPAGRETVRRLHFQARWDGEMGQKGPEGGFRVKLRILTREGDPMIASMAVDGIEKLGKRKNWVGGRDGYGVPVEVDLQHTLS